MAKRVFLIVLDSFGVGAEPDAPLFGDVGTNTLGAIAGHPNFRGDNLARLGMFNLDGVTCGTPAAAPIGSYARLREASAGKDTTIGHWEIAGLLSAEPLPTFPDGFPQELLDAFTAKTGYKVLCNKPYSGTDVIRDYGEEHMKTGALIVYTSADSVFQIAANEAIVPVEKLYEICAQARELLTGKYGVGRVIARPFVGDCAANFTRTPRRHDYSLVPPHDTMLDAILAAGKQTIGVGKIHDIFAGKGIGETIRTSGNTEGLQVTLELADRDFEGLAFVNLVDFDMLYGHRRDIDGYAAFYMGGIAGKVAGAFTLKNCINRGNLTAAVERDIAGIAVAGDNNAVFDGCENYGNITVVANHKTDKWRPIVAGIVAIENDKVTTITNCTCKCTIDATLYQATSIGAVYVFQKTWEKGVEDTKTVCDEASKTNSAETTIKITTRE